MSTDELLRLYQALGWAGIIGGVILFLFIRYLWPFYLSRVAKNDQDREQAQQRREQERQEFLATLATLSSQATARNDSVVAAIAALTQKMTQSDQGLIDALNAQRTSTEIVQKTLVDVLEKLSDNLSDQHSDIQAKRRRRSLK